MEKINKSYSDQIEKLPVKSSSGNQYIFMMYHYTTNNIYAVPIKNRHVDSINAAWLQVYGILKEHDKTPNLHILENECDTTLKQSFKDKKVK